MAKYVIRSPADYQQFVDALREKARKISEAANQAGAQAVADIALDCLSRSVKRAPVEVGDLRGSGYVSINGKAAYSGTQDGSVSGGYTPDGEAVTTAEIGFTAKYAMVQHEHVEFDHPQGGQAKYLESVVDERSETWKKHLKNSVKQAIKEA